MNELLVSDRLQCNGKVPFFSHSISSVALLIDDRIDCIDLLIYISPVAFAELVIDYRIDDRLWH